MDATAPILFFDSGVGGLSVLAEARRHLPQAPVVYVADSAGFPYGTKSEAELAARVPALLGRLVERYHPRLAVIACNTASTIALTHVRAALDIPVVGTVPAIKPAAELSKNRVIGVLGTEATVRQPYVADLSARFASDCVVVLNGAQALVQLAERKLAGEPVRVAEVAAAARPGFDAHPFGDAIDTVVLACTHFPLLQPELSEVFAYTDFVDGAAGIARRIAVLTQGQQWPVQPMSGTAVFTGAGPPQRLAQALAGYGLTQLHHL